MRSKLEIYHSPMKAVKKLWETPKNFHQFQVSGGISAHPEGNIVSPKKRLLVCLDGEPLVVVHHVEAFLAVADLEEVAQEVPALRVSKRNEKLAKSEKKLRRKPNELNVKNVQKEPPLASEEKGQNVRNDLSEACVGREVNEESVLSEVKEENEASVVKEVNEGNARKEVKEQNEQSEVNEENVLKEL